MNMNTILTTAQLRARTHHREEFALLGAVLLALTACSPDPSKHHNEEVETKTAIIAIDGSSTVYPITEAVAEEFQVKHKTKVTIGVSGTGGGFKKFCASEIALGGASRPIKPSEVKMCKAAGIDYIELPVAFDGIAVVVHPDNSWVNSMTVEELKKLWEPEAQETITQWSQIREGWPDRPIQLLGPGVDSGTYDYFTKAIVGTEHASRGDFIASEDDNVLVQGVSRDKNALGFFGYAYYKENADKLKLVAIDDGNPDNGQGPIAASMTTISDNTYQPLSRPIFVYVSAQAAKRQEVADFVHFYLNHAKELANEVGYVGLPSEVYTLATKRFDARLAGSIFAGEGSQVGVSLESMLAQP